MKPYAYPKPRPTPKPVSRIHDPVHRSEVECVYRNASLLDRQLDALHTWFHRASRGKSKRVNLGVCFELYVRVKTSLRILCACGFFHESFEELARLLPEPPYPDLVRPDLASMSPEDKAQFEKLTGRPLRNWWEDLDFIREQLRKLRGLNGWHGVLKSICATIEQAPEIFKVPWPEGALAPARPPVWDRIKLVKKCADNYCVYFRNFIYPITYEQYLFLDALVRAEGGTVSFNKIPGLEEAKIERVRKGLPAKILRHIKTDRTGSRLSDDVFDLRLMPWGDGTKVPTSGTSLFVVGTDTGGLLHVRIFDASRKRVVDTGEKKLPGAQAAAIAALKRQLPGLMLSHPLTDAEKQRVIREVTSIVGLTLDDVDN
jgi:hypothetical protein